MKWLLSLFLVSVHWFVPLIQAAEAPMGGIGVGLGQDKQSKALTVVRVLPETPAAKAGLTAGLVLKTVADTPMAGKSLEDCIALVRGPVGSTVKLELLDPASDKIRQVELTREVIQNPAGKGRIGDAAAPLVIKEWIKGGPVDVKDDRSVYVIEFWATWCGPCRISIPHLSELQRKTKDKGVLVVGISDEPPATVKPFVQKMGEKMEYVVACDESRQTYAGYMEAYGRNGIPSAFVVGKNGRVLWQGHPMDGLDRALEAVLAGKDPKY